MLKNHFVKLFDDQVKYAMNELNVTSFTDKFPKVDRVYSDPQVPLQAIGLISFTPAKGATPNKDGVFDCSPFLRVLFNDLNVIKLDLISGVPSWKIKKLEDYTEAKFMFRSKYRWDVVKDKLGIAL